MSTRRTVDPRAGSTRAGYAIPNEKPADEFSEDEATVVQHPPAGFAPGSKRSQPPPARASEPPPAKGLAKGPANARAPGIEIEYVLESRGSTFSAAWPMLEIWTRNRIYYVDASMVCVQVTARDGTLEPNHSLRGARLTGGERRQRDGSDAEIYFPFPLPGTEAVFRSAGKRNGSFGRTSTIERVILKARKMRVGPEESDSSWKEITGRFFPT